MKPGENNRGKEGGTLKDASVGPGIESVVGLTRRDDTLSLAALNSASVGNRGAVVPSVFTTSSTEFQVCLSIWKR